MESATILKHNMKTEFSYLIRISVGVNNISMLVKNKKEVPLILLETMAKEKITKFINESYTTYKHYRNQTVENYFNKMIKQSSFEIENLNEIEIFNLDLVFNSNKSDNDIKINNEINEKQNTETRQSSINGFTV